MGKFYVFVFMIIGLMFNPSKIFAGNGPFFVTYDHHPAEKGEVELMLMTDYAKSKVGGNYVAQMLEIEYGVTKKLTTELMLEGQKTMGDTWVFTGWRWENRYRLFERELPVNPMIYVEWENLNGATKYKMEVSGFRDLQPVRNKEAKKEKERILETKLILGKDFGPLTVALNWINESDTRNKWETAFGYTLGARYSLSQAYSEKKENGDGDHNHHGKDGHSMTQWVVGAEMYGALGDTTNFGIKPNRQEHYFAPVLQFKKHLPNMMIHFHLSPAIGLTRASDHFLIRTSIGVEW